MTQTQLHEQFVKGITWKMIGLGILGIISVVSSFWVGYNSLTESIKDGNIKTNIRITAVQTSLQRSQDSIQRINDTRWQYIIDELSTRGRYSTQTIDANGNPIWHLHK